MTTKCKWDIIFKSLQQIRRVLVCSKLFNLLTDFKQILYTWAISKSWQFYLILFSYYSYIILFYNFILPLLFYNTNIDTGRILTAAINNNVLNLINNDETLFNFFIFGSQSYDWWMTTCWILQYIVITCYLLHFAVGFSLLNAYYFPHKFFIGLHLCWFSLVVPFIKESINCIIWLIYIFIQVVRFFQMFHFSFTIFSNSLTIIYSLRERFIAAFSITIS